MLAGGSALNLYGSMLSRSMYSGAALIDGKPAAVWGAAVDNFLMPDRAHLWLVIGGHVQRPAHVIGRGALPFVQQMQTCYARLVTTVTWGHARDHRFIRWLGFSRVPAEDTVAKTGRFLAYERT